MTCFNPLQGIVSYDAVGQRVVTMVKRSFVVPSGVDSLQLPCGRCTGCRLERSRQWAARCIKEASMYDRNCFITLTFSPESLAKRENPLSLDKRDFQLFMKRLRKRFGDGIRYFHCGEYGEKFRRPHYHACLFNFDFPDRVLWKESPSGSHLYTSKVLEELWPYGYSTVGDVTFESAAYVARYILKKHLGKDAWLRYAEIDFNTGEITCERLPEYTTMSRRPGIGRTWLDEYVRDVYPSDELIVRGFPTKPPRYFDNVFALSNPSEFSRIKKARELKAQKRISDNTPDRLLTRENVLKAKLNFLKRNKVE